MIKPDIWQLTACYPYEIINYHEHDCYKHGFVEQNYPTESLLLIEVMATVVALESALNMFLSH